MISLLLGLVLIYLSLPYDGFFAWTAYFLGVLLATVGLIKVTIWLLAWLLIITINWIDR